MGEISPGALIGGSAVSGGLGLLGGMMTNSAQSSLAGQQMSFQEMMSNTAYQRSVSDMKAAGLNPAMMYGSGGPESSPTGAMAQLQNPVNSALNAATTTASTAAGASKDLSSALASKDAATASRASAGLSGEQQKSLELNEPRIRAEGTFYDMLNKGAKKVNELWEAVPDAVNSGKSNFDMSTGSGQFNTGGVSGMMGGLR